MFLRVEGVVEAGNRFTHEYSENCNLVVITYMIP